MKCFLICCLCSCHLSFTVAHISVSSNAVVHAGYYDIWDFQNCCSCPCCPILWCYITSFYIWIQAMFLFCDVRIFCAMLYTDNVQSLSCFLKQKILQNLMQGFKRSRKRMQPLLDDSRRLRWTRKSMDDVLVCVYCQDDSHRLKPWTVVPWEFICILYDYTSDHLHVGLSLFLSLWWLYSAFPQTSDISVYCVQ